jgi:ligand-binding SRPBCC domain-containing protein
MAVRRFVRRTRIRAPAERVFRWHEMPEAFQKLTPPGEPVREASQTGGIQDGARRELIIGYPPAAIRWVAAHDGYVEGRQFRDTQVSGPFRSWVHTHLFDADGPDACYLEDRVEYELPFGRLGDWLLGAMIERKLDRLFEYRHRMTREENEQERPSTPRPRDAGNI